MKNYIVRLEIQELRVLYCELQDVEASDECAAIEEARRVYKESGRQDFLVDIDCVDDKIIGAEASEEDDETRV